MKLSLEFRVRKRVWVGLGVLCAVVFSVSHWRPAPTVVVASGSPSALGTTGGEATSFRTRLLLEGYVKKVICEGDAAKLIRARRSGAAAMAGVPAVYRDEMRAFAESANVDEELLAFGNCFVDLGSRALGCRSTVVSGKRLLHAHNLDWDDLGGMAKWSVIVNRRQPADGRFRTVSVGFAGMIGCLDVINEHGVALSFNQLGTGADVVEEPVFLMMRRIAETCADFESARREIRKAPAGMPFIITLSSAKEGKGAIFERWFDERHERPLNPDGWVAAANSSQADRHVESCLGRRLAAEPVDDVAGLQGALRHPDVLASFNLYSVIFDFSDNKVHLASGSLPAALGDYREYPLF